MRVSRCIAVALALVVILAGRAWAQEMTLSVAVSLKEAVEDLGKSFAAARPGVILRYNFGASGTLQKQIEAGAPIDLFLSAAVSQMDDLEKKSLIVAGSRRAFARNVLTVIMPGDSKVDIAKATDLLDRRVSRIVIGNPKTVPAGQYAEECLRTLGLWERLLPKLVFSENVRQALDYVARGEVDAGFVYTTDLAARAAGVPVVRSRHVSIPIHRRINPVYSRLADRVITSGEAIFKGKPSMLGAASGAVAGLVAITPAAGNVGIPGAFVIGLAAGLVCLWGVTGLKKLIKADDSLDVFGVHALGDASSTFIVAAAVMVEKEMSVNHASRIVFPHPTVSEALREAILGVH